jgi:hypothetical protein
MMFSYFILFFKRESILVFSKNVLLYFELVYINNIRRFHLSNSTNMYSILWTSSPLPLYSHFLLFLPFFQTVSCGFHYAHIYLVYLILFTTQNPFLSPSQLSLILPDLPLFAFKSHYHLHHHHYFRSSFYKWARTCCIWLFQLRLPHSAWLSPLTCIFLQITVISLFLMANNWWYIYKYICYPFISCWEYLLIPQCSYCEQNCNKHGYAVVSLVYWFKLLWINAPVWYGEVIR